MRIRAWEAGVALVATLLAASMMITTVQIGLGMLIGVVLWTVSRARVTENTHLDVPARYTTLRGRVGFVKIGLMVGIYVMVLWGMFAIRHDPSHGMRVWYIANWAGFGLVLLLARDIKEAGDDTFRWLVGARSEREVGRLLNTLRAHGWEVLHGYKRDGWGDLDHILSGPNGVFLIETKSHGFRRKDLNALQGNAAWLKETVGARWVTGVLCAADAGPPRQEDKSWVMSREHLIPWLTSQHNQRLDRGALSTAFGSF